MLHPSPLRIIFTKLHFVFSSPFLPDDSMAVLRIGMDILRKWRVIIRARISYNSSQLWIFCDFQTQFMKNCFFFLFFNHWGMFDTSVQKAIGFCSLKKSWEANIQYLSNSNIWVTRFYVKYSRKWEAKSVIRNENDWAEKTVVCDR